MTVFVGPGAPELDPVGCRVPTGSVIDPSLPRKERSTLIKHTLCQADRPGGALSDIQGNNADSGATLVRDRYRTIHASEFGARRP